MQVNEVAEELGVSKSYAYKVVQKLHNELRERLSYYGGCISKQFFLGRFCYGEKTKKESPVVNVKINKKW